MLTEKGDSQFKVVTGELNHQRMCGFTAKPSYLVLVLWPEQPLIFSFFPPFLCRPFQTGVNQTSISCAFGSVCGT